MTTGPAFTVHSHQPSERERLRREASLDETIEQSFPASDPPSTDPNPDRDTDKDPGKSAAEDKLIADACESEGPLHRTDATAADRQPPERWHAVGIPAEI